MSSKVYPTVAEWCAEVIGGPEREWFVDSFGCQVYRLRDAFVWLGPRPPYCDRGHWYAGVEGIATIDAADGFPRYYMDLERAKAELAEWLVWRLEREDLARTVG